MATDTLFRPRKRRAAISDLYPACKRAGTCPEDVIPRVEQNTLADKILKWGSSFIFLGNLGISSGRGTGGTYGYTTLGGRGVGNVNATTARPSLPGNTVGPQDILPVDVINPLGESLAPPRFPTAVEEHPPIRPERFPAAWDEGVPPLEVTQVQVDPTVLEETPAVLEVPSGPTVNITSHSTFGNPTFEINVPDSSLTGELSSEQSVLVRHEMDGHIVGSEVVLNPFATQLPADGAEEIPLTQLDAGMREAIDYLEETPLTSTPASTRPPPQARPSLYNRRYYAQVPVSDPRFLTRPQELVTFDNPVYEGEDSYRFEEASPGSRQYPSLDFRGLTSLSRAGYARTDVGLVRVSRIGTARGVRTRSGLMVGAKTHYYMDLSEILEESLEMAAFGETSASSGHAAILETPDFEEVSLTVSNGSLYSEADLLDHIEEVGEHLQLVFNGGRNRQNAPLAQRTRYTGGPSDVWVGLYSTITNRTSGTDHSSYPNGGTVSPTVPINPSYVLTEDSDFFLHPELQKRRRRYSLWFIADGGVATRTK
ncbi:MAG: late protein 2 [Equus asinus papillomavirus 3]|nr:MAG: late protein 2 [Equus asinus papillomavirus 3]